jgi:hypothetical protein
MRSAFIILGALLVAAWADAQQAGASLTAGERGRLLQSNRDLIAKLVKRGVKTAKANDPVGRTSACKEAMDELLSELDGAVAKNDADRVSEIGDYLNVMVEDGLIPTLEEARGQVPEGSPEEERLKKLHEDTAAELDRLNRMVPKSESLAKNPSVQGTLGKWEKTTKALAGMFKKP